MMVRAILLFAAWEVALFCAAMALAYGLGFRGSRRRAEKLLAVLAIQITLESSIAAIFTYLGINGPWPYAAAGVVCAGSAATPWGRAAIASAAGGLRLRDRRLAALFAALLTPLVFLSFRPVEEADSINYLHYLIDWMANRATPYAFATNYVAFWELSFLPAWTITRVDFFFPLLELKAVALLALAAWLLGRELGLRGRLLATAVFGLAVLRHLWWQPSGVPTLKNDVLHGAGFVLLVLAVMRASGAVNPRHSRLFKRLFRGEQAESRLRPGLAAPQFGQIRATALFAFGAAFAAVKYTGIFEAAIAAAIVIFYLRGRLRPWQVLAAALFVLATSGHYYLHNLLLYGNPFYPFQINLAFVHLPGTADLSNTSILYHLGNPGVWRAFFLPAGGISGAGLLFPIVLAAVPLAILGRRVPLGAALLVLSGWLLFLRSVYSAGAGPNDIGMVTSLNALRYVIGVLAVSELCLIALLARFPRVAPAVAAIGAASRLAILYGKLPNAEFPIAAVATIAIAAGATVWMAGRRIWVPAAIALLIGGPLIDQRNHRHWLEWWYDLKPAIERVRGDSLAVLEVDDWGYFAGHILAAGNPVHPEVRVIAETDFDALPGESRPKYLAALPTPNSPEAATWKVRHRAEFERWGYAMEAEGKSGAILERILPPVRVEGGTIEAWYEPMLNGRRLRPGEVAADSEGNLLRNDARGRQPLVPSNGVTLRLLDGGNASYRWADGRWQPTDRQVWEGRQGWNTSIGGGAFEEQVLHDSGGQFVRLRANNDARWLIYSAAYPPGLADGTAVSVEATVRCPKGCSVSTAGHHPELEKQVQPEGWTTMHLNYVYQKNSDSHYAVGLNACRRGDFFDLRAFRLRIGVFPYD